MGSLGPSGTVGSVRAALSPVRTLCVKSFGASAKCMSCSFNSHGMTALFLLKTCWNIALAMVRAGATRSVPMKLMTLQTVCRVGD